MKRTFVLVFALGPATILWASSVHVDFDHGRSFSRYGRYAWAHTYGRPSSSSLFPNELMQERIVKFVEEALASRGLVRVDTAPDVLVNYEMTVTEEPQYTTYTDSIGPGWGWSNWGCCGWEGGWGAGWGSSVSTTTMQTIRLGTLAINMTDARGKQLVFQGVSTAEVSSRAEKNIKRLQHGVNEIFEKYPPRR